MQERTSVLLNLWEASGQLQSHHETLSAHILAICKQLDLALAAELAHLPDECEFESLHGVEEPLNGNVAEALRP